MKKILCVVTILVVVPILGVTAEKLSGKWTSFKKITTPTEYKKLPDNAQIAMACSKCKSVSVTKKRYADKPYRGEADVELTVHQCPGCGGTITRKMGEDKDKLIWTHTCSKCGDDSAYCCSTEPEKMTPGMEDKAK